MQQGICPSKKPHVPNSLDNQIKAVFPDQSRKHISRIITLFSVHQRWFYSVVLKSCHSFQWHETHIFMISTSPLHGMTDETKQMQQQMMKCCTKACVCGQGAFEASTQSSSCQIIFSDSSSALSHHTAQSQSRPTLMLTFRLNTKACHQTKHPISNKYFPHG